MLPTCAARTAWEQTGARSPAVGASASAAPAPSPSRASSPTPASSVPPLRPTRSSLPRRAETQCPWSSVALLQTLHKRVLEGDATRNIEVDKVHKLLHRFPEDPTMVVVAMEASNTAPDVSGGARHADVGNVLDARGGHEICEGTPSPDVAEALGAELQELQLLHSHPIQQQPCRDIVRQLVLEVVFQGLLDQQLHLWDHVQMDRLAFADSPHPRATCSLENPVMSAATSMRAWYGGDAVAI
eukprot:3477573-Rhodomonas_salina.3